MSQTETPAPPDDPAAPPAEPGTDQPAEPGTDQPAEPGTDQPAAPALEPGTDAPPADAPPADAPPADAPPAAPESRGVDAAAIEALERELNRHWKAVEKIMGDDFETFVPCPQCEASGSPLSGLIPIGALAQEDTFVQDPTTETCKACNGLGERTTGSRQPHNLTRVCAACTGQGFTTVPGAVADVPALALVPNGDDPEVAALKARGYTVLPPFPPAS